MPQRLPRGLDPVTAGRWGWWLMGKRQQLRASRRTLSPPIHAPRSVVDRVISLNWRWNVERYPGQRRALAELLGITPGYARQLMSGQKPLPAKHAERLAAFLEADLAERQAVIAALRAHAAERRETRERPWVKGQAAIRGRRLKKISDARIISD